LTITPESLVPVILRRLPGVVAVYLFGSEARGAAREESDLDLAVLAEGPIPGKALWETAQALAALAGREVDLIDLARASTVMQMQVVTGGRRVHCADENACESFEDRVYSSYAWLNEERKAILQEIEKRGKVYG